MKSMMIRTAHRRIAVAVVLPLTLTAVTGVVYRVGRNWFGMSRETGDVWKSLHTGGFLGEFFSPLYVLVTGLGLLALVAGGAMMWRRDDVPLVRGGARAPRATWRWFHRVVSMALALPLALTAATGIGYWLVRMWLGWPKERAQWMMDLHQGTLVFGKDHRVYYAIFLGVGLLLLIVSGSRLMRLFRRGGRAGSPATPRV